MGLLLELRKKLEDGTITEEEKKQLIALEADVKKEVEEVGNNDDDSNDDDSEDEDAAVEDLAEKLAKSFTSKVKDEVNSINKQNTSDVKVTKESRFIVDKSLGRISVDELDKRKVELTERKAAGKTYTQVSEKTVHFIQALVSDDKQKLQTLVEGTGARGGFLVPEDFSNILIEDRRDATVMRQVATVIPMTGDSLHLGAVANRPKASWRAEAAVKATTTVDFSEVTLTPYSLAAIVSLSDELVADASIGGSIINVVSRLFVQSLSEEEDKAFWTGDGSGKPTGIDNYSFNTIVAGLSDSSRADAIIRAIYALPQGYRRSASVVANKNTLSKVATLKDNNGNYLLSDLAGAASPVVRGLPIREQNDLADGKAFVGDFSDYYIGDRQGITIDTSTEGVVAGQSAFERNLTFVRAEERVDGELTSTRGIVEVTGLGGA